MIALKVVRRLERVDVEPAGECAVSTGAVGHFQASKPPGSAAPRRWAQSCRREARVGDQPGDHGVRVPHVAGPQLVAPPHGGRDGRDEVDQSACDPRIGGELVRSPGRFAEIGDRAVAPAANLVAKQAQPPDQPTAPVATTPRLASSAFGDGAISIV